MEVFMKTKRVRYALLALVLLGSTAIPVGAGGQQESSAEPGQPIAITFRTRPNGPGFDADVDADIAKFEQMMADAGTPVTVEIERFAGSGNDYHTKNTLELRSRQGPDLLFEESGAAQPFMRAGFLLPLDDFVQDWEPWSKLVDPFVRWMSYDGHVYMIPIQSSAIPLYYRKDLFARAGLDTEWQPTSWDEIIATAERLKTALPDVTPLLFIGGKEAGGQVTFSRFNLLFNGAGGQFYDPEDDKWIVASQALLDVFEFYETITERGLTNPGRAVGGNANDWTIEAFSSGAGAINLYGSWAYQGNWGPGKSHEIPNRDEIVGYAKMPAKKPGASFRKQDFVSQSGGWNYMVPASSTENVQITWKLIDFFSTTERQAHYNATKGQAATRWDVMEHPTFQTVKFLADTSKWLEYTYMKPRFFPEWLSGPQSGISDAIGRIMVGEWTAMEAMQNFAKEMEQVLGPDKVRRDDNF
jgi:multiple sugar transport system substrate-binding protein